LIVLGLAAALVAGWARYGSFNACDMLVTDAGEWFEEARDLSRADARAVMRGTVEQMTHGECLREWFKWNTTKARPG